MIMNGYEEGRLEMERLMDQEMHKLHDEMLDALGELGAILADDKGDEAAFCAKLPAFAKMTFAALDASVNDRYDDEYCYTLLSLAAENGQSLALAALLAAGANPRAAVDRSCKGAARYDGATAMHWAAASASPGARECLGLLAEAGADMDALDPSGRSPLAWAAKQKRLDNMAALLGAGARLGEASDGAGSAWSEAAEHPEARALLQAWGEAASLRDELAVGAGEPARSPRL